MNTVPTRGNDPTAAMEVMNQYGVHPNAEEMIAAHLANRDPELRAALSQRVDEEATALLDLRDVERKLDLARDQKVVTATVRAGKTVALVESPDGRRHKAVVGSTHRPPAEGGE